MADNGLDTFSMHSQDEKQGPALATINAVNAERAVAVGGDLRATLDPDTAARRCLDRMIASDDVPMVADETDAAAEYASSAPRPSRSPVPTSSSSRSTGTASRCTAHSWRSSSTTTTRC
ncbi:hypothetical protein ACFYOT_10960 [Saccharothrix saharensis]|uniref:hypothetical protein n=1 Tax=Saccharothrix saharensis TaxID=571190 RepID=UPI0036D183B5